MLPLARQPHTFRIIGAAGCPGDQFHAAARAGDHIIAGAFRRVGQVGLAGFYLVVAAGQIEIDAVGIFREYFRSPRGKTAKTVRF